MDLQGRSLRIGAAVILCAVVLRLGTGDFGRKIALWLQKPNIQSFLIYLETGRNVRFSPSLEETEEMTNPPGEAPEPATVPAEEILRAAVPVFSPSDARSLEVSYSCALEPDLEALLTKPLNWDLTGEAPRVLILHTHTTESYTRSGEDYQESAAFRTLDEHYNMISIGSRVAQILDSAGISVIHDRELHDYPSYSGSYSHAREAILRILEQYPSISLVLDLHRDASGDLNDQLRPVALVEGENTARLMLVMGTEASGLSHPNWQENLALGLKLQAQLERQAPGITRPLNLRAQRFNQDLTVGSLLVEVGAAGNTHREALRAAEELAEAIIALSRGTRAEQVLQLNSD